MKGQGFYFTIQTADGYTGEYATEEEAEHERRVQFGNRALAHRIIKVSGLWNKNWSKHSEPKV